MWRTGGRALQKLLATSAPPRFRMLAPYTSPLQFNSSPAVASLYSKCWSSSSSSSPSVESESWRGFRKEKDRRAAEAKLVEKICGIVKRQGEWSVDTANELEKLKIRLRSKLLNKVLRELDDPDIAHAFFQWAGKQPSFDHSLQTYHAIIEIMGAAQKFDAQNQLLQHDLYLEHADLAHDQPSVRPFEAPVVLEAPVKLLYELLQKKGFIDAKRRPLPIDQVASQDDHRIVAWYRSIAIGLLKYHSFCDNLSKVRSIANYLLRWSAIYTLAKKHKSSSSQIIAKHTKSLVISKDVKTLAAYLTPMEISQYKKRFIVDLDPTPPEALIDMLFARLVQKRLLGERCAVKGCLQRHVEMHHIRQIEKAGGTHKVRSAREAQILEGIKALQGTLNKKHIPLCVRHHDDLHTGKVFIDDLDMNVVI